MLVLVHPFNKKSSSTSNAEIDLGSSASPKLSLLKCLNQNEGVFRWIPDAPSMTQISLADAFALTFFPVMSQKTANHYFFFHGL